jgi:phosphoglycerate dehydrogenase-like enzyme
MPMKIAFLSKTEVNIRHLSEGLAPHPVTPCRSPSELLPVLAGADVLVVQNQGFAHQTVDRTCLEAGRHLKLIQHHGVACDATDVEAATRLGIPVATVPGQNSRSVAEHGFYLLLALARRARAAQRLLAAGSMGELDCTELAGKTLCVVGLGTIGKLLAAIGRGFSMRVIGVRRNPGAEDARAAGVDAVYGTNRLREALAQSDFVVLVLPLDRETMGLIGEAELRAMKPGAMLINMSRGPHVDRAALEAALGRNGIAGFATDAYWIEPADPADPLLRDERVIVTPHLGGKSIESIRRTVRVLRDNIERVARGEPPENVVNAEGLRRGVKAEERGG